MRIWMKWVGMLALLSAVVAGFYVALREQPIAVDIATITVGPMKVTIDEEGVTRVKDVYSVSSPIAGHLDRTTLDEGEPVKANVTVIASIHPLDPPFLDQRTRAELKAAAEAARSAVALAKVELQRAQTAYALASSNYERAAKLEKTNTISISQLERAHSEMQLERAQIASTRATIKLREAELDSAEARLQQPTGGSDPQIGEDCCVSIVAPIDGVILRILARSEQAVSPGTRIAEIGDPQKLEIVVDLLSSDAAKISVGANVEISDWGGAENLQGIVRRVEPAAFTKVSSLGIEEQRVNVIVDLLTVPSALGHGYRVLSQIGTWQSDRALQVPISALFRTKGRWSVFLVQENRAVLHHITIGQMNDSHAEVLNGLNEDLLVVLYPNDLLKDRGLVEVRSDSR